MRLLSNSQNLQLPFILFIQGSMSRDPPNMIAYTSYIVCYVQKTWWQLWAIWAYIEKRLEDNFCERNRVGRVSGNCLWWQCCHLKQINWWKPNQSYWKYLQVDINCCWNKFRQISNLILQMLFCFFIDHSLYKYRRWHNT